MQDHDQSLSERVFGLVLLASPFDLVPSRYYYFVCLLRASSGWMSRASPGCIQDTLSSRAALGRVRRASKGILHTSHRVVVACHRVGCRPCITGLPVQRASPDCRTDFTRLIVIELRVAHARLYVCKIPYRRARLVWRLFSL